MSFYKDTLIHLSHYKKRLFPDLPNGYWKKSNPPKELDYAFTPRDQDKNLIEYYSEDFSRSRFKSEIKRHMYFHHLNSSQAMCINFFYPLFAENRLDLITDFLGFRKEKIAYDTVAFEKISAIDSIDKHRPTNFDFYFETVTGKKFFFEIKYTEHDFGKAPKDSANHKQFDKDHIEKFNAVYKDHLSSIKPEYQEMNLFLCNYQIMRNLIHIGDNSYVVFIYPRGNEKIKQGAEKAKNKIVIDRLIPNFFTTEWESVFNYVLKNIQKQKLTDQMKEFKDKYFI
jgi:hypothetical protein